MVTGIFDPNKSRAWHHDSLKLGSKLKYLSKRINKQNTKWSLEVVEVVLVKFNLVDNQYQQKSEVFYTYLQVNILHAQ